MKNITRRDFIKGLAGTVALGTAPSFGVITNKPKKQERTYAWSTAIEEEAVLRNEVSDLMKKTKMDIEYYPDPLTSSSLMINPSQIIGYDMPIEKLYEAKRHLTEFVSEAKKGPEDHGAINLYRDGLQLA